MERSNGYLQLVFNDSFDELKNKKMIRVIDRNKISFYIDNLFFKEADNGYLEVLGTKIGELLDIDCVKYDLLQFRTNDITCNGVISENFIKDGYSLVPIYKIIDDYLANNNDKVEFNEMNLKLLKKAINYRYLNYKNRDMVVNDIMHHLKEYFLLDILLGNIDNGKYNREVLENEESAKATAYFDFGQMFKFGRTRLTVDDTNCYDAYDNLRYFLTDNESYFDKFIDMYNKLTPDKLEELIKKVENEKNFQIDKDDKNIIFLIYSRHYQKLGTIIDSIINSKRVKK